MTAEQKILVCLRTGGAEYFADDLFGVCARCGHQVRFRPYMPTDVTRVCFECMPKLALENHGGKIEIVKETRDELALYYAKARGGAQ